MEEVSHCKVEIDRQEISYDQLTMWINCCRVADRQIGLAFVLNGWAHGGEPHNLAAPVPAVLSLNLGDTVPLPKEPHSMMLLNDRLHALPC